MTKILYKKEKSYLITGMIMEREEFYNLINKLSIYSEFVVSENIKMNMKEMGEFNSIIDARSLGFFSLGQEETQKSKKSISYIVDSKELSNTLTSITELKYKQKKMIILAIGESIEDGAFIDVTDKIIKSEKVDLIEKEVCEYINKEYFKPMIINIQMTLNKCKDNLYFMQCILNKLKKDDKIFTNLECDENKKIVKWKNDYGVISRYLGNIVNSSANSYLLTTYDSFCKDINTFYCRYMSKNAIIFFIKHRSEEDRFDILNWTNKNKIKYIKIDDDNKIDNLDLYNLKQTTIIEILI